MAQLTINIPDPILARSVNGFCKRHGYSATLPDGSPNPQTKVAFVKARIIEFWRDSVVEQEAHEAAEAAVATARQRAQQEIDLT